MTSHRLLAALLVALLVAGVTAATSQKYSLLFDPKNSVSNNEYRPTFDLGILEVGYSLQVTLTIPNTGADGDLKILIPGTDENFLKLYYIDSASEPQAAHMDSAGAPF